MSTVTDHWPLTTDHRITMRHQKAGRKFKRSPSHRRMLLRNLATALLEHGKIQTTLAKAKEVQPFTEKLITLAKDGWNLEQLPPLPGGADQQDGRLQAVPRDRPAVQGAGRAATPASTSWPRSARAMPPPMAVISLLGEKEQIKAPTRPAVVVAHRAPSFEP